MDEEEGRRANSFGRGEIQQSPLIGMPKLRLAEPQKAFHSRDRSHLIQQYNTALVQPQHHQIKQTPEVQQLPQLVNLNKEVRYEDALDKFMTERHSQKPKVSLEAKNQQITSLENMFTPREKFHFETQVQSRGLLTSRNNEVAKSTASFIIKKDDLAKQYSSVKQPQKHIILDPKETNQQSFTKLNLSGTNSPTNGSPNQVQKKIKEIQSTLHSTTMNDDTFLNKVNAKNKELKLKKSSLFNINPATIPENGRYQERGIEGSIKRSLALAPSTYLGQKHKEEIDEEIQKREYTKLGGNNLPIAMPSDLNNINYHRSNPMKDYTYNNLTGAYYYKATQ